MPKPLLITDYVDENLKLVRDDDGTDTAIQLSKDRMKIVGDLDVTGNIDSATVYAGQILGYTDIGLNEADTIQNLTTSYAVPTDEFSVSFVAPPSGNVEIFFQVGWDAGSSIAGDCYAGLSTANATSGYSALASHHEFIVNDMQGRAAVDTVQLSWTITGLTAGTDYEYWVGFKAQSTSGTPKILWGGTSGDRYPEFIMKATALPATITT